ncbi:MAG: transglycosylase SLT domain-containing protein [Oligoflexia bacterium]|nr:transglycosylase SLT domain-containing protein [Oligoflexia bacterium]
MKIIITHIFVITIAITIAICLPPVNGAQNLSANSAPAIQLYSLPFNTIKFLKIKNHYFDIPVTYNKSVKKWMNYFLNEGRHVFINHSKRAGRYAPIMQKILIEYGLPRDLIFLAMAESGFLNRAKSMANAIGPWQFIPETAANYGLVINYYVDERKDPIKSTIAAGRYLKKLYSDFNNWELALAAYNAGEGKISRAIKNHSTTNFWNLCNTDAIKSETKNYLPKIMALAIIGKNLNTFNLEGIDFAQTLDFEEMRVVGGTQLQEVAEKIKVPVGVLQYLNPELTKSITPPIITSYNLRIPVSPRRLSAPPLLTVPSAKSIKKISNGNISNNNKEYMESIAEFSKENPIYIVSKKTTLAQLAKYLDVPLKKLSKLNQLKANDLLVLGDRIILPFSPNKL